MGKDFYFESVAINRGADINAILFEGENEHLKNVKGIQK